MSRSSKIELLYFCVLIESLAGYAYDEKHNGRHTDGKHDDLYPHGTKHAKHDKDATFAYQIVETDRTFTYDAAGKLVSATETEDNYGTYIYTYEYDLMGNRTYMEKTLNGTVAEWHKYEYNESNQLVSEQLYNGKKTTSLAYTYDADGNRITETGKVGTDKVEKTYEYTVENRLAAVHDGDELLLAAAYDGDGNRVFLLNYNLHTDDDWKGNSGNGNGNNKDNSGSGNNGKGNSGNNGNGNGNGKGKGNNKKNSKSGGTDDAGYGNATNAEENNSQNQCGILFPVQEEVSATEADLIARIKTTGKEKNYELIEYLNDVNREHAEVLVEQNINGRTDISYIYGAEINGGFDRISLDRFDGSTGYYLYDARGSVSGITNEEGQVYQSYRYSVTGEITFGAPQYENEYTYNGESYNPNIESQYLRARYYCVVTATFLTEDSYLGSQTEPLTLNRYNYCVSSYLNYTDPSGNKAIVEKIVGFLEAIRDLFKTEEYIPIPTVEGTPIVTPAPIQNDSEDDSYIQTQENEALGKSNIEDCILLNEAQCKVENYDISYVMELLMRFEEFRATPYYATAAEKKDEGYTIGYGHRVEKGMDPIYTMTEEEARKQLEEDIRNRFPSDIVNVILENHGTLTQNQLDALVALGFNNTAFTIKKSQEFMEVLKEKDYLDEEIRRKIASQFMTYSLQNDERLRGLVKRSAAEAIVFLENNYLTEYDDLYSDPDVIEIYRNFLIKYEVDNLEEYLEYLE